MKILAVTPAEVSNAKNLLKSAEEKIRAFRVFEAKIQAITNPPIFSKENCESGFEDSYRESAAQIVQAMKHTPSKRAIRISFDDIEEMRRVIFYVESLSENLAGFTGRQKGNEITIRRTKCLRTRGSFIFSGRSIPSKP